MLLSDIVFCSCLSCLQLTGVYGCADSTVCQTNNMYSGVVGMAFRYYQYNLCFNHQQIIFRCLHYVLSYWQCGFIKS